MAGEAGGLVGGRDLLRGGTLAPEGRLLPLLGGPASNGALLMVGLVSKGTKSSLGTDLSKGQDSLGNLFWVSGRFSWG